MGRTDAVQLQLHIGRGSGLTQQNVSGIDLGVAEP